MRLRLMLHSGQEGVINQRESLMQTRKRRRLCNSVCHRQYMCAGVRVGGSAAEILESFTINLDRPPARLWLSTTSRNRAKLI